jgi:hypothetical protein
VSLRDTALLTTTTTTTYCCNLPSFHAGGVKKSTVRFLQFPQHRHAVELVFSWQIKSINGNDAGLSSTPCVLESQIMEVTFEAKCWSISFMGAVSFRPNYLNGLIVRHCRHEKHACYELRVDHEPNLLLQTWSNKLSKDQRATEENMVRQIQLLQKKNGELPSFSPTVERVAN